MQLLQAPNFVTTLKKAETDYNFTFSL